MQHLARVRDQKPHGAWVRTTILSAKPSWQENVEQQDLLLGFSAGRPKT